MSQFSLITCWHLDAPIDRIWEAIAALEDWPRRWRYVRLLWHRRSLPAE